MVRSLAQQEQAARQLLRNAFATGCDDDAAIDFAASAMGEDARPLIGRVLARDFKIAGPV